MNGSYNGDGLLDLIASNKGGEGSGTGAPTVANQDGVELFRNLGGGAFERVTTTGVNDVTTSRHVWDFSWGDCK